jgi:hypothetical protein
VRVVLEAKPRLFLFPLLLENTRVHVLLTGVGLYVDCFRNG